MKPKLHSLLPAFALAIILPLGARALTALPAGMNAGKIPDITVWDEADVQHSLWQKLQAAGPGPVIILPVYTRCTMSCPVLARMLVQQTSQLSGSTPFRVLIFSFDPGDDAEALHQFRAQKNLPPAWILVRSRPSDIRRFCDFFHYSVMTEGPVMIHTNQMFLLDHTLQWRATFIDETWDAAELRTWMKRVESPGPFGWLTTNPELLVYIGFGVMLLSLIAILTTLVRRTRVPSDQIARNS
jgi:cytochrome oxidase Cu insertion factor (SCO1/SenC/PrrC family)